MHRQQFSEALLGASSLRHAIAQDQWALLETLAFHCKLTIAYAIMLSHRQHLKHASCCDLTDSSMWADCHILDMGSSKGQAAFIFLNCQAGDACTPKACMHQPAQAGGQFEGHTGRLSTHRTSGWPQSSAQSFCKAFKMVMYSCCRLPGCMQGIQGLRCSSYLPALTMRSSGILKQ